MGLPTEELSLEFMQEAKGGECASVYLRVCGFKQHVCLKITFWLSVSALETHSSAGRDEC